MDWFLYDNDLRHERVKSNAMIVSASSGRFRYEEFGKEPKV